MKTRIVRVLTIAFFLIAGIQAINHYRQGPLVVTTTKVNSCPVHGADDIETPSVASAPVFETIEAPEAEAVEGADQSRAEEDLPLVDDLAKVLGGTPGLRWVECAEEGVRCTAFLQVLNLPEGLPHNIGQVIRRAMHDEDSLPFVLSFGHGDEIVAAFGDREVAYAENSADGAARLASKMMESGLPEQEAVDKAVAFFGLPDEQGE